MIEELRGIPHFNIQSEIKNKKSICTSRTFGTMSSDKDKIKSCLAMYTAICAEKLRIQNSSAASAHIFLSTIVVPFFKQYIELLFKRVIS